MTIGKRIKYTIALMTCLAAMPTFAADDVQAKHDERVKKDLFAVISLEGHPCRQVISFERQGKNDYIATCQTGDRYRVYVTAAGRAAIQKY